MTSKSVNKGSFGTMPCTRPLSPIITNKKPKTNSLLTACCSCSRAREKSQVINKYNLTDNGHATVEETKPDVQKGFFKRIQNFKGSIIYPKGIFKIEIK